MRKRFLVLIIIVFLSLVLAAGLTAEGQKESEDAEKIYKIRFSLSLPDFHFMAKKFTDWAALVEEKSGGKIDMELFYAGQLYKDNKIIEAIQSGAIESGLVYTYILPTLIEEAEIFNLMMLFETAEEILKVIDSKAWEDIDKRLEEEKNIKVIALFPWPVEDFGILTPKPVHTPDTLKGLKIRTVGVLSAKWMESLGGYSTYVTGAEVYMALQRGTLDGSMGQISGLITRKQYEVAPCFVKLPIGATAPMVVFGAEYFTSLPENLQKVILDAGAEIRKSSLAYGRKEVAKLEAQAPGLGADIYSPTEAELKLWKKDIKEKVWLPALSNKPEALAAIDEVLAILGKTDQF